MVGFLAIVGGVVLAFVAWKAFGFLAYLLTPDAAAGEIWLEKRLRSRGVEPADVPVELRKAAVDLARLATLDARTGRANPPEFMDMLDGMAVVLAAPRLGVANAFLAHEYRAICDHAGRLTIEGKAG